jgi:hypothetical protein
MKYYKTDSRRISFTEYWHMASTVRGFLLASFNKIIGKQMDFVKGIAEPNSLREKIIPPASIPATILANLDSGIAELKRLGFDQFWYYSGSKESLYSGVGYSVQAMHASRQTIGKIVFIVVKNRQSFSFGFVSQLGDERFYFTTNNRRKFNPAPKHFGLRKLGTTSGQLWNFHRKRLESLNRRGESVKTFADFNDMVESDNLYIKQNFEDKIRRGIWVEMTDAEVAACKAQLVERAS